MSDPNQGSTQVAPSTQSANLRVVTPARVALDRTGSSLTTRHALEFSLAHAQARDAVHSVLAVPSLLAALRERDLPAIAVKSAARDRVEYLRRPDLGRRLCVPSAALLAGQPVGGDRALTASLAVILADGLSALATDRHALPVLDALLGLFDSTWRLTPIVVAEQARVALGDDVGLALRADAAVVLIGERPGLSSADSLGAYITWAPRPGRSDAERNCVSNIRVEGLHYEAAAARIAWTLYKGRRLGLTGIGLRVNDSTHQLSGESST